MNALFYGKTFSGSDSDNTKMAMKVIQKNRNTFQKRSNDNKVDLNKDKTKYMYKNQIIWNIQR